MIKWQRFRCAALLKAAVSLKTHDLGHKNLVLALFPFLWQLVQKTSFEGERRDQMTTTPLLWQKDIPWGIYCLLENEDVFRVQKNLEVVIDDYSQFLWVLLLLYLNYDINNNALLNRKMDWTPLKSIIEVVKSRLNELWTNSFLSSKLAKCQFWLEGKNSQTLIENHVIFQTLRWFTLSSFDLDS